MKRTFLLVLVAIAATAAWSLQAQAQQFSNPILIGGDEPSGATSEARTSQATNLKFFIHSETQDTDVNFKDDEGRIEAEDLYDTIFVDDVVATPGYAPRTQQVTGGSNLLDHPASRMGFSNVSPIGPEDFSVDITNPGFFSLSLDYMYEYSIADEPANLASHRLMLADIREETSGEFIALFGEDPLEKVLIGGIETALIGSAAEVAPYSPDTYPATVIAKEPFQWCAINVTPIKPFPSTHPCFSTPTWDVPILSKNKYKDVFLYDVANLGNGFVGASYDPLQLGIKWKIGATYTFEMTSPPIYLSGTAGYELPNRYYATYYSPLAQFRQVSDGAEKRYRFSGYSSLELPSVKIDLGASPPADVEGIFRFLLTNWVIPMATNPISTEAVDLGGASSWQSCSSSPCSPAVDFPDTDLAVVYQTTFFPLDHELDSGGGIVKHNYINGPFGRPAVFGDGDHHTLRELLGTCSASPCSYADFTPLPVDRFPDSVISLAMFYRQENGWAEGGDNQAYDKTNPSHVFEPANSAIIGPGAYDSAVLTDYALDATYRKQFLVVPSAYDDPTSDSDKAVLYLVDPLKGENLFFLYPHSDLLMGYNIFTNPPLGPYNPAAPRCEMTQYTVKKTPLRLPQEVIRLERPSDGFVPHEVVNGKLDNNDCDDFVVTWRGKKTVNITADNVAFDDGTGTSKFFSSRISIVLRHEAAPGVCKLTDAADYGAIPKYIDVGDLTSFQVASAAIGDFDGDGKNDIAVGNLIPEEETAYAYLYKGGTSVPFSSLDRERFRVGFKQAADIVGVGKIAADHTEYGADALAQINGLPLMLPDIDCPNYSVADDRTVGSIFETYISIAHNFASRWVKTHGPSIALKIGPLASPVTVHIDPFENAFPFVDLATNKPMPTRCAPEKAACVISGGGVSLKLPFYEDDTCCVAPCAMPKAEWLNRCASYVYAYGRVGRACPLVKYVYAWGDVTDPSTCGWSSSTLPASGSFAEADDRGGGDGGDTDYARLWQPDRVVGHDGGAIAYRDDLVPAQLGSAEYQTNTLNVQPSAEATGTESAQRFDASVGNDAGGFALFNMKFPLRQLLGTSLAPLAETSGDARQIQDVIYSSEEIDKIEKELGRQMPGLLMGAPSSFEHMILQPIVAEFTALVSQAGGLPSANKETARKGPIFGGCSLVADSPEIDLSAMVEKMKSLACRLWDLIVPNADAATCGDGTIDDTENCDGDYFCKKGPCPSMAGTTICRPPWDAEACTCNSAPCGDGCWIPTASLGPESCDLTAKPYNWNGLAWATGSGFFNPTDPDEQNYGCPKAQSCKDGCICGDKRCGDGQINEGETCDPAADETIWPNHGCPSGQDCSLTCGCTATITTTPGDITPLAVCGDGIKNGTEQCDPAAPSSGADCPSGYFCVVSGPSACMCQTVIIPGTTCGNSTLEPSEKCDGTLFAAGVNCSAYGNPCRDSASTDPCTCCGDGVKQVTAGEECDPMDPFGCGAAAVMTCTSDCKCVPPTGTGPSCGNGVLDPGESCDIGNPCPAGQYCTVTCDCKDVPKLDWDVKLPIGTVMPGHREGTAVVRKRPVTCNYNGIPGDLPSEECDTAGLTPADAQAQVASVCTSPPVDGAVADVCDMSDCSCNYDYPWCAPDAECSASGDCPDGMICSIECVCVADPGESVGETPDPQEILATQQNDCFVHCDTFSTDADAEVYRKWNEEARSWSGRTDDLFCEPEQLVSIVCRVGAGSAVDDTTLPSLTSSESPLTGTTTLPYMFIQRSGSEFIDTGTLEYKEFTLVDAPVRILPMEGADASKAVVLPNLSSSADLAGLEGVAPMAVSSVAYGAGGVVQVNNMIEHRMFSLVPGQDYQVTIEGSAQTIKAEGANIPEGAAITIHEVKLRLPPDCASWTGVAGYQGCPNIEDRQFSADAVKSAIEANKAALGTSTAAIYTDLPWEQNLNYNYNLIQSVFAAAGESAPPATYVPFGHLAGKPLAMGAGGGCGCNVADGSASMGSIATTIIVLLVPFSGIVAGAIRRKRRR